MPANRWLLALLLGAASAVVVFLLGVGLAWYSFFEMSGCSIDPYPFEDACSTGQKSTSALIVERVGMGIAFVGTPLTLVLAVWRLFRRWRTEEGLLLERPASRSIRSARDHWNTR